MTPKQKSKWLFDKIDRNEERMSTTTNDRHYENLEAETSMLRNEQHKINPINL